MPNEDSIIVEDERKYNWTSDCNNCGKKIFWNHQVRHPTTRRCLPMEFEYSTAIVPKRHKCMGRGTKTGQYINKYEGKSGLKKTWCEFCDHFYDLSHWCIFTGSKNQKRPQLMCMKEVQLCNHNEYYDPLTNGWFSYSHTY